MADKVLFFTCAYNAEKTMRRTMDSILNQTHNNWVYYVLDNGSSDSTGAIIREYEQRDDRIHHLSMLKNSRTNYTDTAFGMNNLLSGVEYDWLAILDSDDEYDAYFAEKLLKFALKNNLDMACCATQGIADTTGGLVDTSYWQLPEDLVLAGDSFSKHFSIYFPFTWSIWAKLISADTLQRCDFSQVTKSFDYGADGVLAREIFKHSVSVGISRQILHKYYIHIGSEMTKYRNSDIDSNCVLHDNMKDYLVAINGANEANFGIVYSNYATSIRFIVTAILNAANLTIAEKLTEFKHLFSEQYTIDMVANPYVPKEQYIGLFSSIANWILSQNGETENLGVAVWLLLWLNNVIPAQTYVSKVKKMLSKSPITAKIDVGEAYYLRDPISEILDGDLEKAFNEIGKLAEDEIPDKFAEAYLRLAQNISASMEYADGYIFFVKQWIDYLIEHSRYNEAAAELEEMQKILPEDEEFKDFRNKIYESLNSNVAIADNAADSHADGNQRKTSIVIVFYNNLEYNKLCISSLKEHTKPGTYELIVVDNASTDGSAEWLRSQTGITAIYSETNLGFTAGCNLGISQANPDNDLLILNNDVVLTPNWLENLKICLYSDDFIGAVGAASSNVANFQSIPANYTDLEGGLLQFATANNISNPARWEERMRLIMVCVLVKNEAWQKVGKLDEIFSPGNFEDDDYAMRLRQAGYRLMLCKDSYIHHIGSASFRKEPQKYGKLLTKNREVYRRKWGFDAYEFLINDGAVAQILRDSAAGEFHDILHIGCRGGSLLLELSQEYPNAAVAGVSYTPELLVGDIAERLNILTAKPDAIPEGILDRKYQAIIYFADKVRFKDLCRNLTRLLDIVDEKSVIVLRTDTKLSKETFSSSNALREKMESFNISNRNFRENEYAVITSASSVAAPTGFLSSNMKPEVTGEVTTSVIIFGQKNMSEMLSHIKNICSCAAGTSLEILVINIWNQNLNSLPNRFDVPIKILNVSGNKNISHLYNNAIELCEDGADICLLDYSPSTNWLGNLQTALHSDKTAGVAFSCVAQNPNSITSNPNAWKMRTRITPGCVLIGREAFRQIGGFDESFETAEYSIDDISVSMQLAGFKLLQCEDSQISIPQNITNESSLARDLLTFKDKWGFNPRYSNFIRNEIIIHIDKEKDAPIKVLEVGCGCGATLVEVKNRYKNAELFAVEFAQTPAKIASKYAETRATDIERTNLDFSAERFDYIIFADVLEHLVDPWKVVKEFKDYLTPNGAILSSIPNVMHWEVVTNLLNGSWDYADAGILDRTHLRFFTLKSIREMFHAAGFKDISVSSVSMGGDDRADKLAQITRKDLKQQYLTYQYIVKAVTDGKEQSRAGINRSDINNSTFGYQTILNALESFESLKSLFQKHSAVEILNCVAKQHNISPNQLAVQEIGHYHMQKGVLTGGYGNCLADLQENFSQYEWLYNNFKDPLSKSVFTEQIRYRVIPDIKIIQRAYDRTNPQYFDKSIVRTSSDEVFVDCGAYIGDTVESYIATMGAYKRIYSYEPSMDNYKKLCALDYPNIVARNAGVGAKSEELYIIDEGASSRIGNAVSQSGQTTKIKIVSLDDDITEPVTFIKMDIEGAEIDAINGAARHIRTESPKLAICLYHHTKDIWQIPRLINSINPSYRFYFRQYHGETNQEYIIYAIPPHELIEN